LFGFDEWSTLCLLPCSLNELPIPPFNVGLTPGTEHEALMALGKGDQFAVERIKRLQIGHVASLNYIAQKWGRALQEHPGVLIKRWSHALFPADNQPSGDHRSVLKKFSRLGGKFIARGSERFRSDHPDLKNEFNRWRKAALKKSRKNGRDHRYGHPPLAFQVFCHCS
jgi:hypothetical protein